MDTIADIIDKHLYNEAAAAAPRAAGPDALSHLGDWLEEPYSLIESYFQGQYLERLARHQIESYNNFMEFQIQRTIQMFNPVVVRSEKDYVAQYDKYYIEVSIAFDNFAVAAPMIHENNGATKLMFPQEAKLRNFTYASTMTVDITMTYTVHNTETMDAPATFTKVLRGINIGKMPIMIKSSICVLTQNRDVGFEPMGECPMDCGGYFIIKGSEKTVLGQERAAENKVFCFEGKPGAKWIWTAEIKSVPDSKCISPKQMEMMVSSKNSGIGHSIFVAIPRVKHPIELFVLFRALGVMSDKAICEYIALDVDAPASAVITEFLRASIIDAREVRTREAALKQIVAMVSYVPFNMDKDAGAKKKHEFTLDVLNNDLFPHCRTPAQKLYMLGYMARKLITAATGGAPSDDRDSYVNKRIELTGTLLNNLFRNYFNKLVKEMQKHVVRELNSGSWRSANDYCNIVNMTNIYKILKSNTVENGINRALSTGDFSIKQSNSSKVGVAQVLNRLTYASSLSHLRRINTPLDKSGELIAPRKLHNTTWGFLCPVETPEGQSVGVVKNLSYLTHITIATNVAPLYETILPAVTAVDAVCASALFGKTKVFINGAWVGVTDTPRELFAAIKANKHSGVLNIYTSVAFDYKLLEIRVCSDGGRLVRPLLRVRDGSAILTTRDVERVRAGELGWNDLLTNCVLPDAVIEYIDPEEQNGAMVYVRTNIATGPQTYLSPKYTHCEIHPSTAFGILASCIPFPDHNQSPRNCYQTAMCKQALGVYALNYDERMDKSAYVLTYPSRPMVDTRLMNFLNLNRVPSGEQVHVAIMSYTGYNQEDSVLLNEGSVDRGMFMATIYHTEKDEDKNVVRDEIIRCKPDATKTKGVKFGNYDKLDERGFIPENTRIGNRDVIIAKTMPIKECRNDPTKSIKFEDQSKVYRTTEESYIDKNYTGRNGDGYNFAKVRVRVLRKPNIGDKFATRSAQKGTCGLIIPERDMPYTAEGLRPDIILNPHAIPSRMTIAQLKETILGKVLVELGMFGDGTAFGDLNIGTIIAELQKLGYHRHGEEIMYDGHTGEQLKASIFIGPCFYQRLKHMVSDKQHSRAIGPMVNLTRQPAEGRSRDGGFRVGEMERDVMIAHGMSQFCRDRLYSSSDKYAVHVCKRCGMTAAYNDGSRRSDMAVHKCHTCDNTTDFARVEIPYAFKLLSQELQTINVVPRLITE